jgi:hypothetical protein
MRSGAVAWASWAAIGDSAHYPSQTLAALPPNPLPLCAAAPPPLPSPPLSILAATPPYPSRPPPSPPPKVPFLAARIVVAWCESSIVLVEGRREEGKGGIQGDFCVHLLFICAAIQLIRCCVCDWVEGLSRILGGG